MFKNFCAKKRYRTLSASKSSVKLNESLNITRLNTIFEEDLALQKRQTKIEFQEGNCINCKTALTDPRGELYQRNSIHVGQSLLSSSWT